MLVCYSAVWEQSQQMKMNLHLFTLTVPQLLQAWIYSQGYFGRQIALSFTCSEHRSTYERSSVIGDEHGQRFLERSLDTSCALCFLILSCFSKHSCEELCKSWQKWSMWWLGLVQCTFCTFVGSRWCFSYQSVIWKSNFISRTIFGFPLKSSITVYPWFQISFFQHCLCMKQIQRTWTRS